MQFNHTVTAPLTCICGITCIYIQLVEKATQVSHKNLRQKKSTDLNLKLLGHIYRHQNKKLIYFEMKIVSMYQQSS